MSQGDQSSITGSKALDEDGLCLLSLDGGGVRGLSSLYILQAIMYRVNIERENMGMKVVKPCEIFDLIGGTSTGGLIAIMLGRLEMTVDECIDAYKSLMAEVFVPVQKTWLNRRLEIRPLFDSNLLRTAIKNTMANKGIMLPNTPFNVGVTRCRVFVCAKTKHINSVAILRSYNTNKFPEEQISICDAAMATTAAPKIFEPTQIGDIGYVDGALGANNPVEYVEKEASDIWCPETGDLKPLVKCFISIGTGKQKSRDIEDNAVKLLVNTMVGMALETEDTASKFIGRWREHYDSKRYFRFNVDRDLDTIKLAEHSRSGEIKVATQRYLNDQQVESQMRNLVANMRLKQNRVTGQMVSIVQSYIKRKFPMHLIKRPYLEDKDRNKERIKGTCEWFINHPLFQSWKNTSSPAFLWVSADPGCGKSVLAKSLVDEILPENPGTNKIICYFFFKDDFESQRRLDYAISCLLHQVFSQRREFLTDNILNKLEQMGDTICESFCDLWDLLIEASQELKSEKIVCVLDAFDECEETGRHKLVQALTKLYDPSKAIYHNLKFIVTSRYYGHSRWGFQGLKSSTPQIHLGGDDPKIVQQVSSEIDIVIRARVAQLGVQRGLSAMQQEAIINELTSRGNQTYLWVHVTFEALEENPFLTESEFRESLRELPESVNNAYEKILNKTNNQGTTMRLLQLIIAAETELTEEQMRIALMMRKQPGSFADLSNWWEGGRAFDFMKELCGLIVMRDSKVYLLHQTVREFLLHKSKGSRKHYTWENSISLKEAHCVLAEICLWYLLIQESDDNEDVTCASFAVYAAKNWTVHFAKTDLGHRRKLMGLVRQLFMDRNHRERWISLRWTEGQSKTPRGFFFQGVVSVFNVPMAPKSPRKASTEINGEADDSSGDVPPTPNSNLLHKQLDLLQKQLDFIQGRIHSLGELTDEELKVAADGLRRLQAHLYQRFQQLKKTHWDRASIPRLPEFDFGRKSQDAPQRKSADVPEIDKDPIRAITAGTFAA